MAISIKTRFLDTIRMVNKLPLVEKWLVQQSQNKHSIARKLVGSQYLYKPGTIRNCTRNGINYQLHINDYLDHGIYFGMQDHLDFDRESLLSFIKPDSNILDIGANIGDTTLQMAKKLNGKGQIFSFEPSPAVFERMKTNVSLNNFKNINLFNAGMGDEVGVLNLISHGSNHSGGAFISKDANDAIKVAVTTIDKFVADQKLSKLDFLKIDTEGFEVFVIKGGVNTFRNLKPSLFIEVSDSLLQRAGTSAKELIYLLNELNYQCVRVDTQENITGDYNFTNQHFDIYCTLLT